MRRPLQLESFAERRPEMAIASPQDLTELRQAAYDAGYRDGCDACETSLLAVEARTREAVGAQLQALTFTYQEARDNVLRGVESLLGEIMAKVLPTLAQETLLPKILELLRPLSERSAPQAVTIHVNPAAQKTAQDFLARTANLPVVIEARPDLGLGQAVLSSGNQEQMIDLEGAIQAIAIAISEFYQANWPIPAHTTESKHD